MEIVSKGIPLNKIVVGKPITPADAANTGFMNRITLGNSVNRANLELGWYAGLMHWQYVNDLDGKKLKTALGNLVQLCQTNKNCL